MVFLLTGTSVGDAVGTGVGDSVGDAVGTGVGDSVGDYGNRKRPRLMQKQTEY